MAEMVEFDTLQAGLGRALAMNRPGSGTEHVLVALPSYSVGESLLAHYAPRLPALEHRYLLAALMLHRVESCEMVFVSCQAPGDEVVDYYLALAGSAADRVRPRFRTLIVDDLSPRSVAAKLLARPHLLDELRASFRGRPALIEPWNVSPDEVAVACRLGAPVNGCRPELRALGHKSAGRRLFAEAGVPVPFGVEEVQTVDDVVDAVAAVRRARPGAPGVVVKHDDSSAGDGNVVLDLRGVPDSPAGLDEVRRRVEELPEWYRLDLLAGGVVEELVTGHEVASPSVQLEIGPDGAVAVLSTHEQVLGGATGQVYTGCRFPAAPAYAPELGGHGRAVGHRLAEQGAVGRLGVDFMAARDRGSGWRLFALEVNLRKGGTTHPFSALRNLVPGQYDPAQGRWLAADGSTRAYRATDNLVDPAWTALPPADVIAAVAAGGLQFDPATGTGVVLHMLSCLAVDGRFGITAIGRTPGEAAALEAGVRAAVDSLAAASGPR